MSTELLAEALDTLLACPVCQGILQFEGSGNSWIRCRTCSHRCPVESGIPILFGGREVAQRDEQGFRDALAKEQLEKSPEALMSIAAEHHCETVMRRRATEFHKHFDSTQWILDLGIGYGWHWVGMNGAAPIVGIDISMGNLRLAKKVLCAKDCKVLLVCADAAALPIRDYGIGGVWSVQVFQHFPKHVMTSVLKELDRVLKKKFIIEIYNLNPALMSRAIYWAVGKRLLGHSKTVHMELNRWSAAEWNKVWQQFRNGETTITCGYSELFFHPDLGCRPSPYPEKLEYALTAAFPKLTALIARQVQLRITPDAGFIEVLPKSA